MNENKLIRRIKAGDKEAFNDFCREKYAAMISYARMFLSDEWAQDVVQDVLFSIWQKRSYLDERQSVQGYLFRSIHNICLNYLKKDNSSRSYREWNELRIKLITLENASPDNNPVIRKLFNDDLRKNINEAICSLPPKCREVFCMSYIDDLSNKEIAERLNVSVRTIESHMYYALKRLRTLLTQDQYLILIAILFLNKDIFS